MNCDVGVCRGWLWGGGGGMWVGVGVGDHWA